MRASELRIWDFVSINGTTMYDRGNIIKWMGTSRT